MTADEIYFSDGHSLLSRELNASQITHSPQSDLPFRRKQGSLHRWLVRQWRLTPIGPLGTSLRSVRPKLKSVRPKLKSVMCYEDYRVKCSAIGATLAR